MPRCPHCSEEATEGSRFCPLCGGSLVAPTSTPTETSVEEGDRPAGLSPRSQPFLDRARFVPGEVLADRYRIVGLLGRGGMGEVYRADDLKLGQPVALKFLPPGLDRDAGRLDRFLNEVRTARQVTHTNACRVYDIGEVNGQHFLSMEYVDGEDLASLLRRIGRLPEDRAVQVARQICAGLGAAHEQGILHRDLKPANVMIDGRGRVKLTDFGLAGAAEAIERGEVRSGTPAYMAPEQLAGREVTVRSDLYALGLVLYELFTGKPAFEAGTPRDSSPTTPTSHVGTLDEAIERVILRCLEPEPGDRPASALAVAAALPGGDPLAAALAAGETPSPEMVADAGSAGGLRPAIAVTCLVLILFGLVGRAFLADRTTMPGLVDLELPPEALQVEARKILERAGHTPPPVDSARGFDYDRDYVAQMREISASADSIRPAPIFFWYRQSSRHLTPTMFIDDGVLSVTPQDPPATGSGMADVWLDPQGRLLRLEIVPPQRDATGEAGEEPDWTFLFDRAGIDAQALTAVAPEWSPLFDCDLRRAWEGTYPDQPEISIRVEAGARRGRAVFFRVVMPWTRPEREPVATTGGTMAAIAIMLTLLFGVLAAALVLARRNLRLGRGDRTGAARLAALIVLGSLASWLLYIDHQMSAVELALIMQGVAWSLLFGAATWTLYIALEPYARRLWPHALVSWSRLLRGRFRDPLVGRDVLIGALAGVGASGLFYLEPLLAGWLGLPFEPQIPPLEVLASMRQTASAPFGMATEVGSTFIFLLAVLLLQLVLRRQWIAAAVMVLLLAAPNTLTRMNPAVAAPLMLAYWGLLFFVLLRFGLVAFMSARIFLLPGVFMVLTGDLSAWYAARAWLMPLLLAGVALCAFRTSLAGRPVFGEGLLEPGKAGASGPPG